MRAAAEKDRPENIKREDEIYFYDDIRALAKSASKLEGKIIKSICLSLFLLF
jgi:hypothetical protein